MNQILQIIWIEMVELIWKNKPSMIMELTKNSFVESYSHSEKTLKIAIKKTYLEKIIIENKEFIRVLFERKTKKSLIKILINSNTYNIHIIEPLSLKVHIPKIKSSNALFYPISHPTNEKHLNESVFQNSDCNSDSIFKLSFYNNEFNTLETIKLNNKDLNYNKFIYLSFLIFWTIFPFLYFLNYGIKKKSKIKNKKILVKNLLNNQYVPIDNQTQNFVNKYIK